MTPIQFGFTMPADQLDKALWNEQKATVHGKVFQQRLIGWAFDSVSTVVY